MITLRRILFVLAGGIAVAASAQDAAMPGGSKKLVVEFNQPFLRWVGSEEPAVLKDPAFQKDLATFAAEFREKVTGAFAKSGRFQVVKAPAPSAKAKSGDDPEYDFRVRVGFEQSAVKSEAVIELSSAKNEATPDTLRVVQPELPPKDPTVKDEWARRIVQRVADRIYPARVIAISAGKVTFSRGEGSGVEVGQIWEVVGLAEETKDPETGAVLPREQVVVGRVRVVLSSKVSSVADILENKGIQRGAVLKPSKK